MQYFARSTIHQDTCDAWLPNAFTPNGDGHNDLFRLLGIGLDAYQEVEFAIYNRFGQVVFYSQDIYAGWNGRFNNVPQEIGTYFYKIKLRAGTYSRFLTGDLTLVR